MPQELEELRMHPQARLSICMVSDDFLPAATGVGSHLQQICPHLAARNHQVSVITTRRRGEPSFEIWEGVRVYRIATLKVLGFYQGLPSTATIKQILGEVRPHVIHHHYLGMMLLQVMRVAKGRGLPQIYTYHMTEDHLTQPIPMRPFRTSIARQIVRCCNRSDLVISVSEALAGQLPDRGIRTPVRYISNPVGFPDQASVEPLPRAAAFVVMFAGRLDPEKNLPYLLRAFGALLTSIPDSMLWIAGQGSQKSNLCRLARDLAITERVQFLGFLGHDVLARYYASCDVFVLPSLFETQGLVAMEAMWFGKPLIVARSVVSARELVDEGHSGFVVDQTSESDLVRRLAELASDPERRADMGRAAQKKAAAYRPELIVEQLETAYFGVVERAQDQSPNER
jgi:glycosyltransferase involved in cell wall biosynthesis